MPDLLIPNGAQWQRVGDWQATNRAALTPVVRLPGTYTRAEFGELLRLRNSHFFLVRNDGGQYGEPLVCGRCGAGKYPTKPHAYLTLQCVERPFRGVEKALFAYAKVHSDDNLQRRILADFPDLEAGHPITARHLIPQEPGEDLIAVAIGTAVPISVQRAQSLSDLINSKLRPSSADEYFAP